jgi:hypothetical protein
MSFDGLGETGDTLPSRVTVCDAGTYDAEFLCKRTDNSPR